MGEDPESKTVVVEEVKSEGGADEQAPPVKDNSNVVVKKTKEEREAARRKQVEEESEKLWGNLNEPSHIGLVPTKNDEDEEADEKLGKTEIRQQVWDFLEKHELLSYPRPPHKRIPHFRGSILAGRKLATLSQFNDAKVVKVNLDKPQEEVRFEVLKKGKVLLVPPPRLRSGLFNRVNELPEEAEEEEEIDVQDRVRRMISRNGIERNSKPLSVEAKTNIDMFVIGAVAVDRAGHRIGNGAGFADLEYAMAIELGNVTSDTIVVATVHDCQVFDSLPAEIFEDFDVPVDIIVTPTEIIEVKTRLSKPSALVWEKIPEKRVSKIMLLNKMKIASDEGRELKDDDLEPVEKPKRRFVKKKVAERKRNDSSSLNSTKESEGGEVRKPQNRNNRNNRNNNNRNRRQQQQRGNRRRRRNSRSYSEDDGDRRRDYGEDDRSDDERRRRDDDDGERYDRRRRYTDDDDEDSRKPKREVRRYTRTRQARNDRNSDDEDEEYGNKRSSRDNRRSYYSSDEGYGRRKETSDRRGGDNQTDRRRRRRRDNRADDQRPMLYVGKIPRTTRVTELKGAISERGVRTKQLLWKRGYAFLFFEEGEDAEEMFSKLQDLKIGDEPLDVQKEKQKEQQQQEQSY